MTEQPLPVWNLDTALPDVDASAVELAAQLELWTTTLTSFYDSNGIAAGSPLPAEPRLAGLFGDLLARTDPLMRLQRVLSCWHAGRCWADGTDAVAAAGYAQFQQRTVPLTKLVARLEAWAARLPLDWLIQHSDQAATHLPWLHRCHSGTRLAPSDTELLAELDLHGRDAFISLHQQLAAGLTATVDGEETPIALLPGYLSDSDRAVRQRAHQATEQAWAGLAIPAAACLNALTGREWALARRRNHTSLLSARLADDGITPEVLEALHDTVTALLPTLRSFPRVKAAMLSLDRLDWSDLTAPLPVTETLNWPQACDITTAGFETFSPQLAAHARRALDHGWVDAQTRAGKRPTALCLPMAGTQSRLMLCFDGTYDSVHSLAHELGHSYQHHRHADHTEWQRQIPLGLAETSSMFCETLLLRAAGDPEQYRQLLHASLIGIFQTIAGGYARFTFEQVLTMRRRHGPVSPAELTDLSRDAQLGAYADAFDPESLPGHLWISHPHVYTSRFNSWPYYFGMLFGLALLDPDNPAAPAQFDQLLTLSGTLTPAQLAERFGHNLASRDFWLRGAAEITRQVAAFTDLARHTADTPRERAGAR